MDRTNTVESFTPKENAKNLGSGKETLSQFVYICPDPRHAKDTWRSKFMEAVIVRIYASRSKGSRIYASAWVFFPDGSRVAGGHGHASGYGYHKPSAAAEAAIESAGIKLTAAIEGRGDEAVSEAVRAIAEHVGWSGGEVHIF